MLNPNRQSRSLEWEATVQEALVAVRRNVEKNANEDALRKKLRSRGYPNDVITEVLRLIFDDDEVVVEMAQHTPRQRFPAFAARR